MRALGGPRERDEIAAGLDRRLDEFGAGHPEYPRVFIEEMKRL